MAKFFCFCFIKFKKKVYVEDSDLFYVASQSKAKTTAGC